MHSSTPSWPAASIFISLACIILVYRPGGIIIPLHPFLLSIHLFLIDRLLYFLGSPILIGEQTDLGFAKIRINLISHHRASIGSIVSRVLFKAEKNWPWGIRFSKNIKGSCDRQKIITNAQLTKKKTLRAVTQLIKGT